ncbi:MAG: PEGA domain protein [Candidatus Woesebacteria bacterium GW2011_GWA1_45_8]|uniref:PEGA domain protein n=1 Tax=Candidatus Woesebacteria bacterium GW2011_GWA1_45_8 TaxID=1618559 RepID=A0A0G1QUA8_9BACT|nr:MAG: PEGA domain protein [Candidatus Woesebacteria bacterium GW2011_GWA1_45_8]
MRKLSGLVLFLTTALVLTVGVILYARGYRPNLKEKSLEPTGIVSIKSLPDGGEVLINGEKKGTTNLDIQNLSPGKYEVKISKEGFSTWSKEVLVKKEAVNLIQVVLLPIAPSLQSLTFTGVGSPVASPVGDKIVFTIKEPKERAGIWALNLSTNPLPFFFAKDLNKLVTDTKEFSFSTSSYEFSPDGRELLVKIADQHIFFLLDTSKENKDPKEATLDLEKIKEDWDKAEASNTKSNLKALGKEAESISSTLAKLVFSPDKTKFFGVQPNGLAVVFDAKPQPNGNQKPRATNLPKASRYLWYPDSRHVILVGTNAISVMEVDGSNNVTIYTGSFDPSLVVPWPDGSKIVIATNLNTQATSLPNLYAIELR